jgi:hypothetical protein
MEPRPHGGFLFADCLDRRRRVLNRRGCSRERNEEPKRLESLLGMELKIVPGVLTIVSSRMGMVVMIGGP